MIVRRPTLVAAAFLGNMLGMPTILIYSFGIFLSSMSEFGWTRTEISVALSIVNGVVLVGATLVGRLSDRFAPNWLAATSLVIFGTVLIIGPTVITDIRMLWVIYGLAATVGLATTPVVILKPVIEQFTSGRGAAIGIALCGTGVGAMLIPQYVAALTERGGWTMGYTGLGIVAILAAPLLWFGLRIDSAARPPTTRAEEHGVNLLGSLRILWSTGVMWRLSLMALLSIFSISGVVAHLVPLLRDSGKSLEHAALAASFLGMASIVGRLCTGFALDRWRVQAVGSLLFVGGSLGMLMLPYFDGYPLYLWIFLIGLVLGAEVDMIAFLIGAYFPKRLVGLVFGCIYGLLALGSMISAPFLGWAFDVSGSYQWILGAQVVPLLLAALLCMRLPAYRIDHSNEDQQGNPTQVSASNSGHEVVR